MWLTRIFKKEKDFVLTYIDEAIENIAQEMLKLSSDSDEYAKANKQMIELLMTREKITSSKKIDSKTWALIIANLAGIALILSYEQIHIVSSKAIAQISKLRI